jgi:hypothetical protein
MLTISMPRGARPIGQRRTSDALQPGANRQTREGEARKPVVYAGNMTGAMRPRQLKARLRGPRDLDDQPLKVPINGLNGEQPLGSSVALLRAPVRWAQFV